MNKIIRKTLIVVIISSIILGSGSAYFGKNVSAKTYGKKKYKKKCTRKYHNGLFFTKKDLEGKYVKVKCFISQGRYFEWPSDFTKKYGIKRSFFYAKPQRKGKKSYVSGGDVSLYFTKRSKCKSSRYKIGDYVYVYGKIISFSNMTWTGYNDVGIDVKYMEKTRR